MMKYGNLVKEMKGFLDLEVFEELDPKLLTTISNKIELHTFWLFTLKPPQMSPKTRLITINRDWIGKKNKDASSPVAQQLTCFLMFCQYANDPEMQITVLDISTAFLPAEVKEEKFFYLKRQQGFEKIFSTEYVKLKKYAYGLNTAPLAFHKKLVEVLHKVYEDARSDECLHRSKNYDSFIMEHVDDIFSLSKNAALLKKLLGEIFKLKVTDEPDYYLGYDIRVNNKILVLNLLTYIERAIQELPEEIITYIKLGTERAGDFTMPFTTTPRANSKKLNEVDEKYSDLLDTDDLGETEYPIADIETLDFSKIQSPNLKDRELQNKINQKIRSLCNISNSIERYEALEKVIDEIYKNGDHEQFFKTHKYFPHKYFSLRMYQKIVGILIWKGN